MAELRRKQGDRAERREAGSGHLHGPGRQAAYGLHGGARPLGELEPRSWVPVCVRTCFRHNNVVTILHIFTSMEGSS